MDPIVASTTFATIVSLLSNFKQERKDQKDLQTRDFVTYLAQHSFDDLKEFIVRSSELPTEIDKLLKEDTELILNKLNEMDRILASLLSQSSETKGLAHILRPESEISDQAINILSQLNDSGLEQFIMIRHLGGIALLMPGGHEIEVTEERFLEDDLNVLANLGLLIPRTTKDGDMAFAITRQGIKYLGLIKK